MRTPTPWEVSKHNGSDDALDINCMEGGRFQGWFLRLSIGYPLSTFPDPAYARANLEANAAHIVRCVNAHDGLLKALEDLMPKDFDQHDPDDYAPEWHRAKAALAQAKAGA